MGQKFAGSELKLGQANALVKILGGMETVTQLLQGAAKATIEVVKLLTCVGKLIPLPGTTKFQVNKDVFRKETNVGYFWDFLKIFGDQTEENVPAANLQAHKLEKDSMDGPIMEELGGKKITTLWHFFCLLKTQAKGPASEQKGPLLTNGWANIFYIQNKSGKVWAVHCCWYSGDRYWNVNAHSVEDVNSWGAGNQVFSSDCQH